MTGGPTRRARLSRVQFREAAQCCQLIENRQPGVWVRLCHVRRGGLHARVPSTDFLRRELGGRSQVGTRKGRFPDAVRGVSTSGDSLARGEAVRRPAVRLRPGDASAQSSRPGSPCVCEQESGRSGVCPASSVGAQRPFMGEHVGFHTHASSGTKSSARPGFLIVKKEPHSLQGHPLFLSCSGSMKRVLKSSLFERRDCKPVIVVPRALPFHAPRQRASVCRP